MGATAGVAVAFGPVVGGWLTADYSWRWTFRINVIVAPLAIVGALVFMKRTANPVRRIRIDVPGALLIASGMFLLVFAFSQGGIYGWWRPLKDFTFSGNMVWPATRGLSATPLIIAVALSLLATFVWLELRIERAGRDPLFEFAHLKLKTYRYGLITVSVLAMGQLGLSFVLPVFLQDAKHLSAATNGLWMLPTGLFLIVGSQIGGRLTRRFGTVAIVRTGLLMYAVGILLILRVVSVDITVWDLLPGLGLYGFGIGFALAQLTNVILSEIPPEGTGGASGANSTVRQVGSAFGVSVIGSLLTVQTIRSATASIKASSLSAAVKAQRSPACMTQFGLCGSRFAVGRRSRVVRSALEHGVVSGTRFASCSPPSSSRSEHFFSFLIPDRTITRRTPGRNDAGLDPVEPIAHVATVAGDI
jgi:predicted MFS family arabinose efflux permease